MSRSFKKNPYGGITTARSEKRDKRIANRRLRTVTHILMKEITEGANIEHVPDIKEVSNVRDFDKDGKIFYSDEKFSRK